MKPHVTYLFPTDPGDVDAEKVEEYKALLIGEEAFRKEMVEEEERLEEETEEQEDTISTKRKRGKT